MRWITRHSFRQLLCVVNPRDLLIPLVDYATSRDFRSLSFCFYLFFLVWKDGEGFFFPHVLWVAALNLLVFCPRIFPCPAVGFVYLTGLSTNELLQLSTRIFLSTAAIFFFTSLFVVFSYSGSEKRSQRGRKAKTSVCTHAHVLVFLLLLLLFYPPPPCSSTMIYRMADQ